MHMSSLAYVYTRVDLGLWFHPKDFRGVYSLHRILTPEKLAYSRHAKLIPKRPPLPVVTTPPSVLTDHFLRQRVLSLFAADR